MGFIAWIVVGAIAGFLANQIMGTREGLVLMVILGIVGGLVGGFIAGILTGGKDYTTGINIVTIVVAIIGAVVLVWGYNFIRSRSSSGGGTV